MAYLSVAFFLAKNARLSPPVLGHIERILRPYNGGNGAKEGLESGHGHGLLTTSIDLPKVELPEVELPAIRVTGSTANSFAIASHKAKLVKDLIAEQRANNSNWLPERDGAASASREAQDDTDLVQELENQFLDKADSVAFSLASSKASVDDIVDDVKLLLCKCDPRVKAEISESDLEGIASWAVKIKGPKVDDSLSL